MKKKLFFKQLFFCVLSTLFFFGCDIYPGGDKCTLTLTVDPAGAGTVALSPEGPRYTKGTIVALVPAPAEGYLFKQWSGENGDEVTDNNTLLMDGDKEVTALFEEEEEAGSSAPSFYDVEIPQASIPALDPSITVADGWSASYLIPSNGINTPSNLFITADGKLLVNSIKTWSLVTVSADGAVSTLASFEGIPIFMFAFDGQNAYVYDVTVIPGSLYKVDPSGNKTTVVKGSELFQTSPTSICAAPGGEVYIVLGSSLVKVGAAGAVSLLSGSVPPYQHLACDSSGALYAVENSAFWQLNTTTGQKERLLYDGSQDHTVHMGYVPNCGFTVTDAGEIFAVDANGYVYFVDSSGNAEVIAKDFDKVYLQGIAADDDGAVYVASRRANGIFKIYQGGIQCVGAPNFMVTPQAIAVTLQGEVLISEDEAVAVYRYSSSGSFIDLYDSLVTQPPLADIEADAGGNLYVAEADEGSSEPSQLVVIEQGAVAKKVVCALNYPSGLAIFNDTIYVSLFRNGTIVSVDADGSSTTYATGFDKPQFMDVDAEGSLYLVNDGLRAIDKVDASGSRTRVYSGSSIGPICLTQEGSILAGIIGFRQNEGKLLSIDNNGNASEIISGLTSVCGLTIGPDGAIYITDEVLNIVIKLAKK